tara:strand:- start:574 stop:1437 length:864 start_codon:yes stop_codon:yes gene_type:complete
MALGMGMSLQKGDTQKDEAFTFTINTGTTGSGFTGETNDVSYILPLEDSFSGRVEVEWGDGSTSSIIDSANDEAKTHSYSATGLYTIRLTGDVNGIQNNKTKDCRKITNLHNWGKVVINDDQMFYGCKNMIVSASDSPKITTNSFINMFRLCEEITEIKNLAYWDVSNVTRFDSMFLTCVQLNPDIGKWNMISATRISSMVKNTLFNRNLANWRIDFITNMVSFAQTTQLSTPNYDQILAGWITNSPQDNVTVHFGSAKYTGGSEAATARAELIASHGWTITDGGTA